MKMSDVKDDPSSVYRKTAMYEFPFVVTKALEFSLFRTYGVPSISYVFHKNKQFKRHAGKRCSTVYSVVLVAAVCPPAAQRGVQLITCSH